VGKVWLNLAHSERFLTSELEHQIRPTLLHSLTINLGNTLGRQENMWGTLLVGRKTCGEHSWKVGKHVGNTLGR